MHWWNYSCFCICFSTKVNDDTVWALVSLFTALCFVCIAMVPRALGSDGHWIHWLHSVSVPPRSSSPYILAGFLSLKIPTLFSLVLCDCFPLLQRPLLSVENPLEPFNSLRVLLVKGGRYWEECVMCDFRATTVGSVVLRIIEFKLC